MTRTVGEYLARVRSVLTLLLVGVATVLAASVVAPVASAESVLLVAALSTAATALLGSRHLLVLPPSRVLMLPARWAGEVLVHLAGRSTDVIHHPQRPRAPGLV